MIMFVRSYELNRPYVMLGDREVNPQSIKRIIKKASDRGYDGITLNVSHADPDYDDGKFTTIMNVVRNITSDLVFSSKGLFTQKKEFNVEEKRWVYGGYRYQMRFEFPVNIACGYEADLTGYKKQGMKL